MSRPEHCECEECERLRKESYRLREETEKLRVQLAGCGVAAMCNTRESLEKKRVKKGDYRWSASYGDVIRCVEREIRYREALEKIVGHGGQCERCDSVAIAQEALLEMK